MGTVTGTGTTNYVAKFTSSSAVGNSQIFDDGTNVGIGTINPTKKLDVNGDALINSLTVGRGNYNYLLNAAFGYGALGSNVSGTMVTAVGGEALTSNTSGSNNTAVGESALGFNTTGGSNTAVGVASLQYNLSGAYSTAVGQGSLQNNTASYNTAVGSQSSLYNSSGTYNTAIGAGAIAYVNTGSNNTALGYRAGYSPVNVGQYNQTPSNSVYLGYQTRAAGNGNNTNEIVIGASADGNGSNSVTIGNTSITNTYLRGAINLNTISNATTDTDKFLVSDSGVIKYRTGVELLSDIGGQGALTLTTTGTSGAATLVGNTLNIPQYQGVISLSAIGSTPNANGATLSSNTLNLQPASATYGGVVTTDFQELAGQKRFTEFTQFDKYIEVKNRNSYGVSWGYTSFVAKDTASFGIVRGHQFSPTPITYEAFLIMVLLEQ